MTTEKQTSCMDPFEKDSIKVALAVEKILQNTATITDFNQLNLRDCLGRVIYQDIKSPIEVPSHDNSAMDGYAVRSVDLPQEGKKSFRMIGTAFAGRPFTSSCGENECVRIMTGAVIPEYTDTIVIQEQVTTLNEDQVEIGTGHRQAQNVRYAGEDIKQGSIVLSAGHVVGSAELGVLASLGIGECKVFRKPRVSFFSTGDELKSIGETLQKGEIYDSNRYSLYGLLSQCNVDIIDMGVIRDDPFSIRQALLSAANSSDVIITSGGVSVGEADYIKGILKEIGDINFWKIAMKPGRPLTFGNINNALFFGLPGNPVAVMVTFYQFVLPCLLKLSGKTYRPPIRFSAISRSYIRKSAGRREFQRAIASSDEQGNLNVVLTGKQGSGILSSMKMANCFIVLPEDSGSVEAGEQVPVEFFKDYF
jgi:molybdopterin molybdotransferase